MRHGCTASLTTLNLPPHTPVLQESEYIHEVNDKASFAEIMENNMQDGALQVITDVRQYDDGEYVVRPRTHAQGRNLWVIRSKEELSRLLDDNPALALGWYARPLIRKSREIRVYVMAGRVLSIAEKTPEDRDAVAWNHAQGASFSVLRWDEWPIDACRVALDAFHCTGLFYSGIDLMQAEDTGKWYTIEMNSAPSLPPNSDGSPSYRHKCVAKGLAYHYYNGEDCDSHHLVRDDGWRSVIHPGIWSRYWEHDTEPTVPVFRSVRTG